jgi:molybdopterin molybdotransferase
MIDVDEAFDLLERSTVPLEAETRPLEAALGRVSASVVTSELALPPFAQSAMDGWAVRAADLKEAGEEAPVGLEIVGEVPAGRLEDPPTIGAGQAARIFTGATVPDGADAVVRQERAERRGDRVVIGRAVPEGKDIRPIGEEMEAGRRLVEPGERLDERHLAALSMTGHPEVRVRPDPEIALLVSGDEVVAPTEPLRAGEIYDANTPFVTGLLERTGYPSVDVLHIRDEADEVRRELDEALTAYDLVVSTGGVSVGDYDFLPRTAEELGAEEVFWKISQKPGKPVFFAVRDRTPFLGLPGNPGAVFVGAHLYLNRLLDALEGVAEPRPDFRTGRLAGPVDRSSSRLRWAGCRVTHSPEGTVDLDPIGRGTAHRMSQLYRADALARIDAGDGEAKTGRRVRWLPVGA